VGISERLAKEYIELYMKYNTPEKAERLNDLIAQVTPYAEKNGQKGGAMIS